MRHVLPHFAVLLGTLGGTNLGATPSAGLKTAHQTAQESAETRALLYAANGKATELKALLDEQPDLMNAKNPAGESLLHIGVRNSQLEIVRMLLDRGADIEALDGKKLTPFAAIFYYGGVQSRVIWLLMGRGPNLNATDQEGNTSLHRAMGYEDSYYADLLINSGANLFATNHRELPILNASNRVPQATRDRVAKLMKLTRTPMAMIPLVKAECSKLVFHLKPGSTDRLSSTPNGALFGELKWSETPKGRSYLGPLGQQKVALKLDNLPEHRHVTVDVELFLVGSWDGNGDGAGPDLIDISVPGSGTLLHSTFYNNADNGREGLRLQSFPDPYLRGYYKGYTGAVESHSLGFKTRNDRDAVYKMSFTFAHTGSLELVLQGFTVPEETANRFLDDESWAIGGLTVKTD